MFLARFFYVLSVLLVLIDGEVIASNITLDPTLGRQKLEGLQILEDPEGTLGIEQIVSPLNVNKFIPMSSIGNTSFNRSSVIWLKVSLFNNDQRDNHWLLDFEGWSYVNAYIQDSLNNFEEKITGQSIPFNKRDYPFANRALINIPTYSGKEQVFYFRLEGYPVKPFINQDYQIYAAPKISMESELFKYRRMITLFFGVFVALLLYEFFMVVISKNSKYNNYLLMLFFILILLGTNSGFIIQFFSFIENLPKAVPFISALGVTGLAISSLSFFLKVFETKENYPRLNKYGKWLVISIGINCLILMLSQPIGLVVLAFLLGLVSLIVIAISINGLIDRNPFSVYYLAAYISLMIGVILVFLDNPVNFYRIPISSDPKLFIASTFEMIFISFGLVFQVNFLIKENKNTQEKVINYLYSNEKLLTKVNLELEQKVGEATKEILNQKNLILDQKEKLEIEKERTENLLLNILPKQTAQELKSKGFAIPKYYEKVSILFTNIYDFSKITKELDSDELVEELDFIFREFDDIVARNNLEKIKTIGDAYLCAGGIPESNQTHSSDAVKAGMEIREFMNKLNIRKKQEGKMPWLVRIGIHTGPVSAGVVGKLKIAYDIWGDTVNFASRMATNSVGGMINVSKDTYNEVKNDFHLTYRGKIKAKNKGDVDMYFVN